MQPQKIVKVGAIALSIATGRLLIEPQPSFAMTIRNGWHYAIDTNNDSTTFNADGDGLFEIYGVAHKIVGETVVVAINSNVDLVDGIDDSDASDGRIDFGDLLINFTDRSLEESNGKLFGVRFAPGNDSNASSLGVYSNVTATSVVDSNNGWATLNNYNNHILDNNVTPSHGILAFDNLYFDLEKPTLNSIISGTKIGDLKIISDPYGLGLDFEFFGKTGSELIAFTFDRGLLPSGKALYHLAMECNNDIVVGEFDLPSKSPEVPTPAAILPTIFGLFGAASHKKSQK